MTRSNVMAISERSTLSTERTPRVSDACFNDWKRFCFVLREIASGEKGIPLSGAEAQRRARTVLTECGYTSSGYIPGTNDRSRAVATTKKNARFLGSASDQAKFVSIP
jgi:hypothetical protein